MYYVGDKVKTSIVIDRRIWEEFKSRVARERGLRMLSKAVEEALEEEMVDFMVVEALKELMGFEEAPLAISPVKPKASTSSGKTVRELRGSRY